MFSFLSMDIKKKYGFYLHTHTHTQTYIIFSHTSFYASQFLWSTLANIIEPRISLVSFVFPNVGIAEKEV